MRTVSRYGTAGYIEDLPSLNQGRYNHGCGAYTDDSGEQVIAITLHYTVYYQQYYQVLMVAGGWGGSNYLSSTEMLTRTSSTWVMVNNLPRRISGVRGVTLGNILYMTG